eukprot:gene4029-4277_t
MQSFPEEIVYHLVGLVDNKKDVARLASSCLWMCRVCRLVHGRRLRLSRDQGKQLSAVPSSRAFSSCRSLEYRLLHYGLATDVLDLQLAVASAASGMPHLREVSIMLSEYSTECSPAADDGLQG